MNAEDFAFIESRLYVLLPATFKEFMSRFPSDRQHRLQNDFDALPCNAELFVILQLQRFDNDRGFDFYELQPELRPRRFMDIGGDGCGNFFAMAGDDASSDELSMWEHDPYRGFCICESQALSDYLGDEWKLRTQTDPMTTTSGTFVLRADHPIRGILNPITMIEWLTYVEIQPNIELDEAHEYLNPFTGELIRVRRWPGRARVRIGNTSQPVTYLHGALSFGSTGLPRPEIERIAKGLNAHVWQRIGNERLE